MPGVRSWYRGPFLNTSDEADGEATVRRLWRWRTYVSKGYLSCVTCVPFVPVIFKPMTRWRHLPNHFPYGLMIFDCQISSCVSVSSCLLAAQQHARQVDEGSGYRYRCPSLGMCSRSQMAIASRRFRIIVIQRWVRQKSSAVFLERAGNEDGVLVVLHRRGKPFRMFMDLMKFKSVSGLRDQWRKA